MFTMGQRRSLSRPGGQISYRENVGTKRMKGKYTRIFADADGYPTSKTWRLSYFPALLRHLPNRYIPLNLCVSASAVG